MFDIPNVIAVTKHLTKQHLITKHLRHNYIPTDDEWFYFQ